jgi:hypothetical protein
MVTPSGIMSNVMISSRSMTVSSRPCLVRISVTHGSCRFFVTVSGVTKISAFRSL